MDDPKGNIKSKATLPVLLDDRAVDKNVVLVLTIVQHTARWNDIRLPFDLDRVLFVEDFIVGEISGKDLDLKQVHGHHRLAVALLVAFVEEQGIVAEDGVVRVLGASVLGLKEHVGHEVRDGFCGWSKARHARHSNITLLVEVGVGLHGHVRFPARGWWSSQGR